MHAGDAIQMSVLQPSLGGNETTGYQSLSLGINPLDPGFLACLRVCQLIAAPIAGLLILSERCLA